MRFRGRKRSSKKSVPGSARPERHAHRISNTSRTSQSTRFGSGAFSKASIHGGKSEAKTSWGGVAEWYEEHLKGGDTYQEQVIAPQVKRLLLSQKGKPILEIGCGEGYFARLLAREGHNITGCDISPELIRRAKEQDGPISYHVSSAEKLSFAADGIFAAVLAVLTLQNMERIEPVCLEVARVLAPRGRFIGVINHPAFRIPTQTSWGSDSTVGVQYRRIDSYLSARSAKIDMHPGSHGKQQFTCSYHRSLQDYSKALRAAGFAIMRIEEWISHRTSGEGPRKDAEDTARKEFPLFLMFEAIKISAPGNLQ